MSELPPIGRMEKQVEQSASVGLHKSLAFWKVLLLAFIAVTAFQGTRGLFESTEGRYAECAREMLVTGRLLEPTLEFMPHWTKPPLTYWGIVGGLALFGQNTWAARAYQIPAFCLTVLAVYGLARFLWGRDVAPYAALVYASAPFPPGAANSVNADTLLALWETLVFVAFWVAVRRGEAGSFRLMWLCLGGAFLTKGPPGLMPMVSVLPIYWFMKKKPRHNLPSLFPASGILLFLGVGFGWYFYEVMTHEGLLHYWTKDEIVGRIAGGEFHRNAEWYKPLTVYGPVLIFGGLPWVALVARHFRSIPWSGGRWRELKYWEDHVEWLFLFLSFGAPLLIFSLSRSRLPLYVLPLFAPMAVALGKGIHWLVENGKTSPRLVNRLALAAVFLVIAGKAVMAYRPSPRNMERLFLEIEEAVPRSRGGQLYFVDDKPLYGLQFYLGEGFTRVSGEATAKESPSLISVSELPARIESQCSEGGQPLLLMAKDQLGRLQGIFPPAFMGDAKFEVRDLDPKWTLVFPCRRSD